MKNCESYALKTEGLKQGVVWSTLGELGSSITGPGCGVTGPGSSLGTKSFSSADDWQAGHKPTGPGSPE